MSEHDDDVPVYVRATLTYSDDPQIELRQVWLGLTPSIYVEPEVGDDEIAFVVTACDLEQDDLVSVLRLIADQLEGATAAPPADHGDGSGGGGGAEGEGA